MKKKRRLNEDFVAKYDKVSKKRLYSQILDKNTKNTDDQFKNFQKTYACYYHNNDASICHLYDCIGHDRIKKSINYNYYA